MKGGKNGDFKYLSELIYCLICGILLNLFWYTNNSLKFLPIYSGKTLSS